MRVPPWGFRLFRIVGKTQTQKRTKMIIRPRRESDQQQAINNKRSTINNSRGSATVRFLAVRVRRLSFSGILLTTKQSRRINTHPLIGLSAASCCAQDQSPTSQSGALPTRSPTPPAGQMSHVPPQLLNGTIILLSILEHIAHWCSNTSYSFIHNTNTSNY